MKRLLRPIGLNEASLDVAFLHRVLDLFGRPVARGEAAEHRAGPDTLSKVRALQAELNVPAPSDTLVNEATVSAVVEALRARGLTDASRAFTVTGSVRRPDGSAQSQQRLLAFDVNLRGAAIFRTVQTLAEIRQNGGFDFLGHATSDGRGRYEISFYDWQYRRAERKKADVVVYAVQEREPDAPIVGRSRLVHAEDYSDAGLVEGLDVTIARVQTETEYERLIAALQPFLKESETSLLEIAGSADQLSFTAGELDLPLAHLQIVANAVLLIDQSRAQLTPERRPPEGRPPEGLPHAGLPHERLPRERLPRERIPRERAPREETPGDEVPPERLSQELLYGIGRQGVALQWAVLFRKPEAELQAAIDQSVQQRIIRPPGERELMAMLGALRALAIRRVLSGQEGEEGSRLGRLLAPALPREEERLAFLHAFSSFNGGDFREFWQKHLPEQPEFKRNPELLSRLLFTQQLATLTGSPALVQELQGARALASVDQLLDLDESGWISAIEKAGVPDFVPGAEPGERIRAYAGLMQDALNAAFPTRRIAKLVERRELPVGSQAVSAAIGSFLAQNPHFDFAASTVAQFDRQIAAAAGRHAAAATSQLKRLQRVFQVSPSPQVMSRLLEQNLNSATSIAQIPRKSFIATYAGSLGGAAVAEAVHQRAGHLAQRAEATAMRLMEFTQKQTPESVMSKTDYSQAMLAIQQALPDYAQLFGSPDLCQCEQCRSVYSAAAYFVDLLRFLWRGGLNTHNKSPLEMLEQRRPDLLHLPLTCENTNTIIPYVDLANEIMEHFTVHDSLKDYQGHDTGEATAQELRASPQHINLEAYRRLKDATYPFTLPYHQPLDVIRTYSGHLGVSRHQAMQAVNPEPDAALAQAIAAEALHLSEEEYQALVGEAFDGTPHGAALQQYFGYAAAAELEQLSGVRELLRRCGVTYPELVELVKTQFINPHQGALDFLQQFAAYITLDAATLYTRLGQIAAGTLDPAADPEIAAGLAAYNLDLGTSLDAAAFGQWVTDHLGDLRQVITLYEADSSCNLDQTQLRTIQSIYEGSATSGILAATWSRLHRFIRLWRKLGWSIHETDLMLTALGEAEITPATLRKLEAVTQLRAATRLPLDQLASAWGPIDTYGKRSLYRKLFLNKGMQPIPAVFQADPWGRYLQTGAELLGAHRSALLAALRLREEDLNAILDVARVLDAGVLRPIDLQTDRLTIANLSTIYRYGVLARALKQRIPDLCKLITLFGFSPFSTWDIDQQAFAQGAPEQTYRFVQLADATKKAGFKAVVLEYILHGTLPADSTLGLNREKGLLTARAIRTAFAAIELDHADTPPMPLTAEGMTAKLALTFQPEIVGRLMALLEGTAYFEVLTEANLGVVMPEALAARYAYVKGSGRLTATGVMTDGERTALKALPGANASFQAAVEQLYAAPEQFIQTNLGGILTDLPGAYAVLLDHPAQAQAASLEAKLAYIYTRYLPVLKAKLRRDAITQHIAALIGLSEAATSVLIDQDLGALVSDLSTEGLSATYYSDATWSTAALTQTDATADFAWLAAAPHPALPNAALSARWEAHLSAPASGTYTLRVDVAGADESFKLYLDGSLVLEKAGGNANTAWEVLADLNAAQMHLLRLEYANLAQDGRLRLQWQSATAAPELLPATAAYPAAVVDRFVALATLYHRAARLIAGFKLSETEVKHLMDYPANFDLIDFKALTAQHWARVSDYTRLRSAVPQAQALLTEVFAAASRTSPAPTVAELKALLHQATAWDAAVIDYLVETHFLLGVADFENETAFLRLWAVVRIVTETGLSAETVTRWGAAQTDFDQLDETAQLLKQAVKAVYEVEDWLDLAGKLSDTIRSNQQRALVDYLLTRPAVQAWGATNADGLYEYLLIDVQMDACMDSSRIVQANASVQLFVNRCLLNLESKIVAGKETGVSPGAIDRDRWEWMKLYRVWEANRKVFLYPENWLEPQWRNDRSEFFKELESHLLQNDITERSVEQAFRAYLSSLNEVANLDVCGIHRENQDDGRLKYLHVFARTHNAPYKFFYRRWDEYGKWSAWERVPVDIRSVEAVGTSDGSNSGVHLVPVVWKQRLFLFWPEFIRVQEAPSGSSNKSMEEASRDKISTLKPHELLEIRLAWSEYVEAKWTPKQVSKEYVREWVSESQGTVEKDILLTASISAQTQELTIELSDTVWNLHRGKFVLADIQSPVVATHSMNVKYIRDFDYAYHFSKRRRHSPLSLQDDLYLKQSTDHMLLPVDTHKGLDITLEYPFFFSDAYRTYFVRPVPIQIVEWLRHPDHFVPHLPGLVDDSRFKIPHDLPFDLPRGGLPTGPDDYLPVDVRLPNFAGGLPTYGMMSSRSASSAGGLPGEAPAYRMGTTSSGEAPTYRMATAQPPAALAYSTAAALSNPEIAYATPAFGGITKLKPSLKFLHWVRHDTGLEFHTFYHPFSGEYVKRLNQGSLPRLMESDTALPSDNGGIFEGVYQPTFTHGLVQKPADFASRTYYKENVCFDVYGANSLYNWELFFHAPLYIATRLSQNGKFAEAMKWFHYIFDPTTDELSGAGQAETARYWKVLPFKTTQAQSLEEWFRSLSPNADRNTEDAVIGEWRDHPFDPHIIAANRPLAYMKHVVMKYVENLIAWGDSLFRQDSRESVNEAIQIYVLANQILGTRPESVPKRGEIKAESYDSLKTKWDDFSNALVELENIFPYSSATSASDSSAGTNLLGVGPALYFCIPSNQKLLGYWETVADRLYKIRHCQNIDGAERKLALFAPPIDPAALIQAASQGLSLGSILADLSSPPPIYRFKVLIQKANDFCADVRALGGALLGALERRDAEELARLRAAQEVQMLELVTAIRERQVLDARAHREGLEKARETATVRLQHYLDLLGNDLALPAVGSVGAALTADSQLPADRAIPTLETDVDDALVDSGESGVKLVAREVQDLALLQQASGDLFASLSADIISGLLGLIPQFDGEGTPMGVGAGVGFGGRELSWFAGSLARTFATSSQMNSLASTQAAKMASYIRREQEWTMQANMAAREIVQLDKQITSAQIRVQIAEKELANHKQQIEHAQEAELFLKGKFTNQELYEWLKGQLFAVYKQSYNLAYEMARQAEQAYRLEMGTELTSFVQYGYWENSRQGLVAGDRLQVALRQLEKAYLQENRRELELSRSISLARLNPLALIQLRETGKCDLSLPEALFDLDFRGHYFRRIKAVRLSIPCIAGPYTAVSCTVRLLQNSVRINTAMNSEGNYEHEHDEGVLLDDERFRTLHVPVKAMATSTAQNDSGLFEFDFRDERYLPFERAGAISTWQVELATEKELRPFDYATIADVILHLDYTARESGGLFKERATSYIKEHLQNAADLADQPLMQLFSLRHDFPSEWHRFLHPVADGAEQVLHFTPGYQRFPFFVQGREVVVTKVEAFARCAQASNYQMLLSYLDRDQASVSSTPITMAQNSTYGGIHKATIGATDAGLNLEELDVAGEMSLKLKRSAAPDYTALVTKPAEVAEILLVFHYKLA